MSGQSINDRITAARLSIAGQGLAKSVCKSTTEEVIGPKKKHLDYLLHCTNEPNVSIPQLANFLIERTNHTNWVVVFKALITVHHLMCYGNERFTQYLASSNCNFQLGGFLDKTGVQGYDMSTYIRRYAKYLNDKAMSYRTVAFDFCKVKRGKDDGILRTMNIEKLLKTIPVLQNQIDSLLEFDCSANELTNGVINTGFMLLFRDLIRLFACYNDGIINLLEKYFDMNKKMCRDALDIYKKFLIRMDRVAEFLKVAESVGIDKGDIPDLTKAPSSLLDALEQHLATLEGRKPGATTPTQSSVSGRQSSVKNAVIALSNTSNAFGTAAAASAGRVNGEEDVIKKLALEEEQAILEQHKDRRLKELGDSNGGPGGTNPFLSSPGAADANNLFGSPPNSSQPIISGGKAYEDLLCLANSNPFADTLAGKGNSGPSSFWGDQNGLTSIVPNSSFVPETTFTAVFGAAPAGQQAVGAVQSGGAYMSEGASGRDKGSCDLSIPGLNPFAAASSATPSPSIPFEFGGPGTTPILGGSETQTFGFGDFNAFAVSSEDSRATGLPVSGTGEAGMFGTEGLTPFVDSSNRPRPTSPSPGTQAPKPTPATSPAPPFISGTNLDAFDEVSFGSKGLNAVDAGGNLFDFAGGGSPSMGGGQQMGKPSAVVGASNSGMDDLNAAISAALSGSSPAVKVAPDSSSITGVPIGKGQLGFESPSKKATGFDAFGDILMPATTATITSTTTTTQPKQQNKVITGDLDSSLASLVQNLDINRAGTLQKSGSMWNSPKNTAKTGGANWTPQVASSTGPAWNSPQHASYQPMVQGHNNVTGKPADWSSGMMAGHFPQGSTQTGANPAPFAGVATSTQPFPRTFTGSPANTAGGQQQKFIQSTQPQQTTLDPFGAL